MDGLTDGQTNERTYRVTYKVACTQLKMLEGRRRPSVYKMNNLRKQSAANQDKEASLARGQSKFGCRILKRGKILKA